LGLRKRVNERFIEGSKYIPNNQFAEYSYIYSVFKYEIYCLGSRKKAAMWVHRGF